MSAGDEPPRLAPTDWVDLDVVGHLPHVVWVADRTGTIVGSSPEPEVVGFERQEDGTWSWLSAVHPDDLEFATACWQRSLTTEHPFRCVHRLRSPRGFRWYVSRARPVRRPDGLRWCGTTTDDEEDDETTPVGSDPHPARLGSMQFRAIRNASGRVRDLVWCKVDAGAEGLIGRTAAELVGQRLLVHMPGVGLSDLFGSFADVVERGVPWSGEFPHRHHGQDRWFHATACRCGDGLTVALAEVTDRVRRVAELEQSERRLRAWCEASGQVVWSADGAGQVVEDAPSWCAFTGQPEAERRLGGWLAAIHPDDRGRTGDQWREAVHGAAPTEIEARVRHKTGWRRTLLRAVPVFSGNRLTEWIVTHVDIDDRKAVEAVDAVRDDTDEPFRLLTDQLPLIVWVHDPDGSQRFVNETFCQYFGVRREEMYGSRWQLLTHPDDGPSYVEAFFDAVNGRRTFHGDVRVRRADGAWRWLECWAQPQFDPNGAYLGHVGASVDVTEARAAAEALRNRERELQTLTDSTPDVLARFDRELRHVFVNVAIEQLTGWPVGAFLGRTHRDLGLPEALCEQWETALGTVFDSGTPLEMDSRLDGRDLQSRLLPERGAGGAVTHVFALTRDCTAELRARTALEDADRRKDEFLATLAHELRNPLAPLRHGLQILRLSSDPEATARTRAVMERQLGHLVRLVDDLLDVSRIRRGKLELRRERLDLVRVVDIAVEACAPLMDEAGHELFVDAPRHALWINGDATRLAQVVSNLLANAAKYTPRGGQVSVTVRRDGREAVVSVTDTGVGVAPEMIPRLFEMFVQVEDERGRAQGGLGIGLGLAKRLLEKHGGTISVRSAGLGLGSTFEARLPLATGSGHSLPPPVDGLAESLGRKRRILVIDDNADTADSLVMVLELSGEWARAAYSGDEALRVARSFAPEIVLCDLGMPGMSGYELAERFRRDPVLASTILVALSGWGSDDDRRRSRSAGFDHHLSKPVDWEALEAVLQRFAPADR